MTDLEVLNEMTKADDKRIRCGTDIIGVDTVKKGCIIKMGIDAETGQDLMKGIVFGRPTHLAVVYVVEQKEFFRLKKQPVVDYKELLKKYIAHVTDCEDTHYLGAISVGNTKVTNFNDAELMALTNLAEWRDEDETK